MTKTIKPFEDIGFYTTFPNAVIDYIMPICKPNTWKIVCATIRNTIGWQKHYDWITISQYMQAMGTLSRETCFNAVHDALDNGFIIRKKVGKQDYSYALNRNFELIVPSKETVTEIGTAVPKIGTVPYRKSEPQKKERNKPNGKKESTSSSKNNREKYGEGEFEEFINK